MSLAFKLERAIRDASGIGNDCLTCTIKESEIPHILTEPARGKFPYIEKVLSDKYGIEIPNEWNVSNVISTLAVGSALLTGKDNVQFDPNSQSKVSLIIDNDNRRGNSLITVDYFVSINKGIYKGSIYLPDQSFNNLFTGMPWVAFRTDQKLSGRIFTDFINIKGFTPLGHELIGFVASQIQSK